MLKQPREKRRLDFEDNKKINKKISLEQGRKRYCFCHLSFGQAGGCSSALQRLAVKLRRDAATRAKVRSGFPEVNQVIVALRKPKIC